GICRIQTGDPTASNRALYQRSVRESWHVEFGRVGRGARHLQPTFHTIQGRTDRCAGHEARSPIVVSARTTAHSATGTLMALSRNGCAPWMAAAPAAAMVESVSGLSSNASSAGLTRHGLLATPPSTTRADPTVWLRLSRPRLGAAPPHETSDDIRSRSVKESH